MKRNFTLLFLTVILFSFYSKAQIEPLDVAELTLKVGGMKTKEIYYGFAEGDQIIFSFELLKGKSLKEIEIIELPTNSKFMDFKTNSVKDKKIKVNKKSVYKFLFKNSSISGRVCKVKIQRIPNNRDLINFNTNWQWKTVYDTTYVPYTKDSLVGYDTTYVQKIKKGLIKIDTLITELYNKSQRVHSSTAIGKSQYSSFNVYLPTNTYLPNRTNPYKSTEVIAWSYWLGVGRKSKAEYEKANENISNSISAIGALTGYGALASLAVTGVSMFGTPTVGDNVQYKFLYVKDSVTYSFDSGNGVSASGRNTDFLQGSFTIQLFNDNFRDGIDVNVKLVCVQIRKIWKDLQYKEQVVKPRYVTLNKQRMVVSKTKIRINAK